MENILTDENGDYGLEYTNAVWASGQMHQDYHNSKVPLSDADFLLEDATSIMVIEYKNANTRKARDAGFKTPPFNPMDDRKFYDSLHYIHLLGKNKKGVTKDIECKKKGITFYGVDYRFLFIWQMKS